MCEKFDQLHCCYVQPIDSRALMLKLEIECLLRIVHFGMHYFWLLIFEIPPSNSFQCDEDEEKFSKKYSGLYWKSQKSNILENYTLILLKVVSLFINISLSFINKISRKRWPVIKRYTSIPQNQFLKSLSLICEYLFFKFQDVCYQ